MNKADNKRETALLEVLVEMTRGDFHQSLELSEKSDYIDAISFLVNRISEEAQSHLLYQAFISKDKMTDYLFPLVFELDEGGNIESANEYVCSALSCEESSLTGKNINGFMTMESKNKWNKKLKKFSQQKRVDTIIQLELRIKEGVLLSKKYYVHSFESKNDNSRKYLVCTFLFSPNQTLGKGKRTKNFKRQTQEKTFTQYEILQIRNADDHMGKTLQEGSPDIKKLAEKIGINPNKLNTGFRTFFGRSILQQFKHKQRIEAEKLLLDSNMQIREIASKVGFNDPSYFGRMFKKELGLSPREFRKNGSRRK